ncbi:hypothetical protein F0562_013842 [Nyssa sinensis]|uniref:BHLH domain-containing protein n=1 Tax=Nyssa sinensis TaxID=561372 RepID=A0A5J4ZNW3_9ASTE|nr:hypothetical protein F0562_013842 [Nyssa sinensis]
MHSDQQLFPQKSVALLANQVGVNYMHNASIASAFGGAVLPRGVKNSRPFHDVEFQTSEVCPKNFIVFDQTDKRSQIIFHPAVAPKLGYPGLNIRRTCIQENVEWKDADEDREVSSSLKEDSDDIDALLSSEEEDQEDYDEEEVSTARTNGNYGGNSPDSCSTYGSKPRKSSSFQRSSGSGSSCNSERKHRKMRKMVKALRGIVPGGNQMNTAAVLDEAVRYLKSLKVGRKSLTMPGVLHVWYW